MNRIARLIFALLLAAWGTGYAQAPTELLEEQFDVEDEARTGTGDIVFTADFGAFRGPEGKTREEVYFQLHTEQLAFVEGIGSHRATFEVGVTLTGSQGDTAAHHVWGRMVELRTAEETMDQTKAIQDQFTFYPDPGTYDVRMWVADRESQSMGSFEGRIEVPDFEGGDLVVSNVQMASGIAPAGASEEFVKQGYQVSPNVNRALSTQDSVVHFYYECYNLSEPNGTVTVAYTIEDEEGFTLATDQRRFRTAGQSFAMAESLPIDGSQANPGTHYLKVQVRDDASKRIASSERSFLIVKPLAAQVLATDEASLERYYKQIRYIASEKELDTYKSLGPEEKASFILDFWRERDPTPGTPRNEFAEEHFRRIQYANDRFVALGAMGIDQGMDTDQGRVYIKFGPPDDIERELNPGSRGGDIGIGDPDGAETLFRSGGSSGLGSTSDFGDKPYEVWTYHRLGGYIFIFRDRRSMGVYELVHTTHPQEAPYDPGWALQN